MSNVDVIAVEGPQAARVPPSGRVTFLFTDIEGSTKLWERYPEAMRTALAAHDALLRQAIETHNGYVFKTVGDAFCAAFPSAKDGLDAALAAQRGLAAHVWGETGKLKARMALHTGVAEERDGDYFGQPLNRVARLMSAGHGDQILLSEPTWQAVHDHPPERVVLKDLGKHRLKDLGEAERVYQAFVPDLPANLKKLKRAPSPLSGIAAAAGVTVTGLATFRAVALTSSESLGFDLFSPLSLYTGLKGLVIELSTYNEYLLLGFGLLFLILVAMVERLRLQAARREPALAVATADHSSLGDWLVNRRTAAFLAFIALALLGSYGYQQYLWRVALPIPDGAIGIALTRDAAAASFDDQLADVLHAQGNSRKVVIRELPVRFNASDTDKARALGRRIGAEAVIIYRVDDHAVDADHRHVAYLVFTDPSIGLAVGAKPGATTPGAASDANAPPVQAKNGVDAPVLRTAQLDEMVNAAAGMLAYNEDRIRDAIHYLEIARPAQADAPDAGIVGFYLGNAYSLDAQTDQATKTLEATAAFYERLRTNAPLGPQDELVLAMTYSERGRLAALNDDWAGAIAWYQKAETLRDDLLANASRLERPSDVRAVYARLYSLTADAYRGEGKTDDEQFWRKRAADEIAALGQEADPHDPTPLIQQGAASFFAGDCGGALTAFNRALTLDPGNINAVINQGVVSAADGRPDLAAQAWTRDLQLHPNDSGALQLLGEVAFSQGVGNPAYFGVSDLVAAKASFEQVVKLDPTNADAYEQIAAIDSLLAQAAQFDVTALVAGDELSLEKSQALWSGDPAKRQAALDAIASLIETRRILASELRPGDADAAVAVANAYYQRLDLIYSGLLAQAMAPPTAATPSATPASAASDENAQTLDAAAQIATWTQPVLANPAASRVAKLNAWADIVASNERVWGFYAFLSGDQAKAASALEQYRSSIKSALALVNAAPVDSTDEIAPTRTIYLTAYFLASAIDQDSATAATYQATIATLTTREQQERAASTGHLVSTCTDERERLAGDAAVVSNDLAAAKTHYEAAIAANPQNSAAALGAASVAFKQGDVASAVAHAQTATQIAGADPIAWADLGRYSLAAGDDSGAATAYASFGTHLAGTSSEQQMAAIGTALRDLDGLVTANAALASHVQPVLAAFDGMLAPLGDAGQTTFQYPALFAQLGRLALKTGDLTGAETRLRRALTLDPHQPTAHADLVIAVIAQGKDASAEETAALAELRDPLWANTSSFQTPQLVTLASQEITDLEPLFPNQKPQLEDFKTIVANVKVA